MKVRLIRETFQEYQVQPATVEGVAARQLERVIQHTFCFQMLEPAIPGMYWMDSSLTINAKWLPAGAKIGDEFELHFEKVR